MADQDFRHAPTGETPPSKTTEGKNLGEIADSAKDTARQALNRASGLAGSAAGAAGAQIQDVAEGQVRSAADMAGSIAEAVKAAAEKLEQSSPESARYVRQVAQTIESLATDMHSKSVGDLMHGASDFARRQPAGFMAAASVAGFMAARFLKSSKPDSGGSAVGASPKVGASRSTGTSEQRGQVPPSATSGSSTVTTSTNSDKTWPGMTSTPAESTGAGVAVSPSTGGVGG
jgi:hypothetical protein